MRKCGALAVNELCGEKEHAAQQQRRGKCRIWRAIIVGSIIAIYIKILIGNTIGRNNAIQSCVFEILANGYIMR